MSDIKVRVRFVTQHSQYLVSDTPFAVPSKLARNGLSKVVNHLLSLENVDDKADISFDFLVNGHLLRLPLEKLIARLNLSTEDVITVEYFPAVSVSDDSLSCDLPAWVSCMSTGLVNSSEKVIVTGCYDGVIRLVDCTSTEPFTINNSFNPLSNTVQHEGPIKDIRSFQYKDQNFIVSCGKDAAVKCFMSKSSQNGSVGKKKDKVTNSFHQVANLAGPLSSVHCLDVFGSANDIQVLAGDWSGNVFTYNIQNDLDRILNVPAVASSSKKSKLNSGEGVASGTELRVIDSRTVIHAHQQAITGLQLFGHNSGAVATHMITGSHDHSLKIWDIAQQDNILTYNTSKVITSLHYSNVNKLILTSHADDKIRMYDSRQGTAINSEYNLNNQSCLKTFYSNVNTTIPPQWIAQVRWHPKSDSLFASIDYNGAVKVWDRRTLNVPLHTLKDVHDGKGLCLEWILNNQSDATIVSGGSDSCVKTKLVEDIYESPTSMEV